jgi:bifunctional non-homologous end joining protein LigD
VSEDGTAGHEAGRSGQLALGLEPGSGGLIDRIRPMLPTDGEGPFDDPGYVFEPWWPGIRAFVSVEGGVVRVRAESIGDPTSRFPELAQLPGLVRADGVVLDATLMVLDAEGRPSTRLLEERLAIGDGDGPAAGGTPERARSARPPLPIGAAALVASDLVFHEGHDLSSRPFGSRRAGLAELLEPSAWCMAARGFVGEGTRVASVLAPLGFTALSARRLDARLRRGPAGDAWFRVPLVAAPRALPPILAVVARLPL